MFDDRLAMAARWVTLLGMLTMAILNDSSIARAMALAAVVLVGLDILQVRRRRRHESPSPAKEG